MSRNLSMNAYFQHIAQSHRPRLRFAGSTRDDWISWRAELAEAVKDSLGEMPHPVALNPEIQAQWSADGVIKQRVIFDVEEHLSAVAYVYRPDGAKGKLPGILACHGHGPFGKDSIMGNRSDPQRAGEIAQHNYDYGLRMARAGYAVIAIDWRGFGERDDRRKPNHSDTYRQRDPCNINYLRATILGRTVLGMDVHDGSRALDYLCGQDFVDADRIGVMGLSFGGTMATWMSICDERIKAVDILCYSSLFEDFAIRDCNFCGSQVTPGLYALCDVPDLQGLTAPRPLLVEMGTFDDCFIVDAAMRCYREVERIYSAAGASDVLELDLFEGGHGWGGNKTLDFFARHLG